MQGAKTAVKETSREMPHILVVDDEKSICELLEITFRKEGYRVEVAHNVESAKRKLESQIFDIIILEGDCSGLLFSSDYWRTYGGNGHCRDKFRRRPLCDQRP
jgi:PleD family two-component response regulator